MPKAKTNRVRKSLSLPRFTPDEGTTLAMVADYYNDLPSDERSTLIRELLVMCLLPQALHHSGQKTHLQVRDAYLIARRMAENHFGIMAVELGLDALVYTYVPQPLGAPIKVDENGGDSSMQPYPASVEKESSSAENNSSLITGQVEAGFMGSLFG